MAQQNQINWKYILIVFAAALFVGGGAIFFEQSFSVDKIVQIYQVSKRFSVAEIIKKVPEIKLPENIEEDTMNWKTYRHEDYGFEIKYPNNWGIDVVDGKVRIIDLTAEDAPPVVLAISVSDASFESLDEWLQNEPNGPELTGKLILDGVPALVYYYIESIGDCSDTTVALKNSRIFQLKRGGYACYISNELYLQLLSSFKFTGTKNVE